MAHTRIYFAVRTLHFFTQLRRHNKGRRLQRRRPQDRTAFAGGGTQRISSAARIEIQLVASEPEIHKPVNIAFDAAGRLWVTSTVEYPFPAKDPANARDTIKILSDFDASGKARKVTTFAEGLNIPIGVLPYGKGAIAHSIPFIHYFEDTTGAGKSDKDTILLDRIGFQKDTHGMSGNFVRNYDGWIYATHGFNNDSTIRALDGSEIKINSGNTYRFRPDGSHIEQYTWGQVNPFGLTIDPLGNIYSCDCHTLPIYQLLRGAYYPSFGKKDDGLGFGPTMMGHLHGSTANCGIIIYSGRPLSGRISQTRLHRKCDDVQTQSR